jgi:protein-L-isoaspartate(D-aspartate) O-methyltransferase
MSSLLDDDGTWRAEAVALAASLSAEGLSPAVVSAVASVPRHLFVPDDVRARAYEDCALPIGCDQTISQPYVVALMTDLLQVERGTRVLEIGTGSGYQTAILCALGAQVFSVEIVASLSERAGEVLRTIACDVRLRVGDGAEGWPEHAPYARIIVTAATLAIPPALVDQLAVGGRMVVPLEEAGGAQWVWVFEKTAGGGLQGERRLAVRFVPMTGRVRQA